MADKKISALTTTTTPLAGTEVLPIVQSSSTKKVSVSDLTAGRTVLAEQLSVGGTASSWSGFKAVDISDSGGIAAFPGFGMGIFRNVYYDGSNYRYKIAGAASFLELDSNGKFNYQTAVSGSANGVIPSFTSRFEVEENTGNTYVKTGNLIIGTSGKGIDFSATPGTGTSELLADYEEGIYTATITPTTSGSVTLGNNTLSYVKIGSQVTVTGYLSVSSVSSPVGYFNINLPFAAASGSRFDSVACLMLNGTVAASVNNFWTQIGAGGTAILVALGGGTNVGATAAQELKANTDMRVSATYRTA